MYIRSTGLGKTLLQCRIASMEATRIVPATLEPSKDEQPETMRLLMTMQVIAPVTWTVRAFVEPKDLQQMFLFVLKNPKILFKAIRFLVFGGGSPSLVVAKKSGKKE